MAAGVGILYAPMLGVVLYITLLAENYHNLKTAAIGRNM